METLLFILAVIAFLIGIPLVIKEDLRQVERYEEWVRRLREGR